MKETTKYFGSNAGKVWIALKHGAKTISQLQNETGLTSKEASMGLGWLAREGKVKIRNPDSLHFVFELVD
jgi:hypothetical protein